MARPTNDQLLRTLLEIIDREGSISQNTLASQLTWSQATLDSIINKAIGNGLVTRGQGGGGGVLRRASTSDPNVANKRQFMIELEALAEGDYSRGIKSKVLRNKLKWDETLFRYVRTMLKEQGAILINPGPGDLLFIAADDTEGNSYASPSPAPAQAPPSSPKASYVPPAASSAAAAPLSFLKLSDLGQYTQDLLTELRRRRDHSLSCTNAEVRQELQWPPYHYWQARTSLADQGLVRSDYGDHSLVMLLDSAQPLGAADLHIDTQLRILNILTKKERPLSVPELTDPLGLNEERVVIAISRLLRTGIIVAIRNAYITLSPTCVASNTESLDELELLRAFIDQTTAFDDNFMVSTSVLATKLQWSPQRIDDALKKCKEHNPPLITLFAEAGIVRATRETAKYLTAKAEVTTDNICLSPQTFSDLRREFDRGTVTAFVGAGVSLAAGVPSWGSLLERLVLDTDAMTAAQVTEIRSLIQRGSYINAASAIGSALSIAHIQERIQRELDFRRLSYPMTASLLSLALLREKLRGVITTNLDALIDIAVGRPALAPLTPEVLQNRLKDSVIHVHGTLDQPSTWAITREQYNRLYSSNPYRDAIQALLTSHTLVFIGYGMADYEIDLILDRFEGSYQPHQQPRHFFFIEGNEYEKSPFLVSRLRQLGMRPIIYRGYENFPLLLARLALGKV